ncbi:tetratricopeptide repeat protein [Alloacidobacterium dinghuense]|uniref:Tetratricopeptide repeat protein n=1 Tax=Alloacidobacterium dinghuense TaxID=2763107 RepID=A0A7G8BF52_9BACT|nr:tetratricopeptide repeat protein [Alloacidobacterium dinghuense]QNI31172.1 tetratricopeptide repeat protein [Alloacidobacterium dinghuense]
MAESRREIVALLFEAALEQPPEQRQAYLSQACGGDSDLQGAVEQLLRDYEAAGSFLQKPLLNSGSDSTKDISALGHHPVRAGESFFRPSDIIANRFHVVRFIDRGGMGEVYEVEDRHLHDVHVALKVIRPEISGDPAMQARFEREVLAARQVVHPHLCPIYHIERCTDLRGPLCFLTMKLLPGETVAARLRRQGVLPLQEATIIVHQIGSGLAAAHKAGIIHRDIKPGNIMLQGSGEAVNACLMDFGLARSLYFDTTRISVTEIAGTPGYLAPELFQGQFPSPASDIYSFGVVAYEMLLGRLPVFPLQSEGQNRKKPDFHDLPTAWQRLIRGCLEADPSRRFSNVQQLLDELDEGHHKISRRTAIRLGAGAGIALGGMVWIEWPRIDFLFNPLPANRSVALMAWPTPRSEDTALLSTIIESIKGRLARAEAYVKNLLVVSEADNPDSPSKLSTPTDARNTLGANLVLAAALHDQSSAVTLSLQLLNSATQKVLRKGHVESSSSQLSRLADEGYALAARVLDLQERKDSLEDSEEIRNLPPEAYREFTEAERLSNEPNNTGLDAAIDKYEKVLALVPKFSLGYAQIAIIYVRKFLLDGGQPCLDLAARNADLSLSNPRSVRSLLSKALVYSYTGKTEQAIQYFEKSLKLDPDNPEVMIYKAETFRDLDRWADEEKAYRELLTIRPNYWVAHNELGWVLSRQARYKEAAAEFEAASVCAPTVALPLANLSTMYIEEGDFENAIDAARRSLAKHPNANAYNNLGNIAFTKGNYRQALTQYQKAVELSPKNNLLWRNIGDCYAMFGDKSMVRAKYARAAELLADDLKTNPQAGYNWMTLAFYHAKIGDFADAEHELENGDSRGASDVDSQFMKVQALALLGKKDEALAILLRCLDKGLAPLDVDLALDLADLRKDPRYKSHVAMLTSPAHKTHS